ncbi:malic nad binding domain protein [Lasius niger]|uniref:Malic nad binding domain protein n=1 Tax=Lasius niger TaxID=67767 RepID=A0A0J7L150_LASNI|nr:malic nad binding domain protein [Lasius niger]
MEELSAKNKLLKTELQELQRQLAAALAKQPPLQAVVAANNLQPAVVAAENSQPAVVADADNPQPEVVPPIEIQKDTFQLETKTRWARAG